MQASAGKSSGPWPPGRDVPPGRNSRRAGRGALAAAALAAALLPPAAAPAQPHTRHLSGPATPTEPRMPTRPEKFLQAKFLQAQSLQAQSPDAQAQTEAAPSTAAVPSVAGWARILAAYVHDGSDGVARVDYSGLAANPADRALLAAQIEALAAAPVSRFDPDTRFAFWVDLYNALTVKLVTDHHPVASIRDISISPGLFTIGPWRRKLVEVEGRALSLDDIEHAILRRQWAEPRVHYVLNCASLGCPDLARTPYLGDDLEARLEAAARAFIAHPRAVRFEDGRLVLSRIFDWYGRDFGPDRQAVLAAIARHAAPDRAARLRGHTGPVTYAYDWRLNAHLPPPAAADN